MKNKRSILFIVLLLIIIPELVFACSCIGKNSVKKEIRKSDVVLVGTIISHRVININDTISKIITKDTAIYDILTIQKVIYKVEVNLLYKGKIQNKIIAIVTGVGNGDCGFQFKENEKYIIYADYKNDIGCFLRKKKMLYTDICKRTVMYNRDEITKIEHIRAVHKRIKDKVHPANRNF